MEIGRSLRTARAAVFAAVCVSVSAAGHVWMSGPSIPAWALCIAMLAVGGAAYGLAGRQRGLASIAALMLTGQLGLHLLFARAQHATGHTMSSMPWTPDLSRIKMPHPLPVSAWLCGGGMTASGASPGSGAMAPMAWMTAHDSAGMVAVHAAAGLLCAWWLRRGEAAVFRLLHRLAQFALPVLALVRPGAPSVPDLTAAIAIDADEPASAGCVLLAHAVVRRGPPAPVFCM